MDEIKKAAYCAKRVPQCRREGYSNYLIVKSVGVVCGESFVKDFLLKYDGMPWDTLAHDMKTKKKRQAAHPSR